MPKINLEGYVIIKLKDKKITERILAIQQVLR